MKIRTEKVIDVDEWDNLVEQTYGRPYKFQQQNGCQDRGSFRFSVPSQDAEDYENDLIPEEVNGDEMGVSFKSWLTRDLKAPLSSDPDKEQWMTDLFWYRNFYPDILTVANDLHKKGLLEAGKYTIDINW